MLNGIRRPATVELAGSMPDLDHIGVPIKPATPDVTPQATQVLDFDPDSIIFSAQGADCWNLVDGLGRPGGRPQDIPLVLSGACIDFEKMEAAGDLAEGVYFVGNAGSALGDAESIENLRLQPRGPDVPGEGRRVRHDRRPTSPRASAPRAGR